MKTSKMRKHKVDTSLQQGLGVPKTQDPFFQGALDWFPDPGFLGTGRDILRTRGF